jgi:hypothetical protein
MTKLYYLKIGESAKLLVARVESPATTGNKYWYAVLKK